MGFTFVFFGTVAVLVQSISSQCIGNLNNQVRGFGNNYGSNLGAAGSFGPIASKGSFGPNLAGVNGPFNSNLAGINGALNANLGKSGQGCASSTGGSFAVTSKSPVSPVGVTVLAENLAIEGPLNVGGNLPFLGTVGVEGTMPSAGTGSVSYGCGGGSVGIVEQTVGVQGPYGSAGSPATVGSYGSGSLGGFSPAGISPGSSYGLSGSLAGPGIGSYGVVGSLGSSAGNFGLSGSPIGSPSGFGAGLGLGFNGLRK